MSEYTVYCGNEPQGCCESKICGMEEVNSKEGAINAIKNIEVNLENNERESNNLYRQINEYKNKLGELSLIELMNRGIIGKCFYSNSGAPFNYYLREDSETKVLSYFRIIKIVSKTRDNIYANIEFFSLITDKENKLFQMKNGEFDIRFSDLDSKYEIDKDTFYQKRDEFFNEFKSYMG